MLCVTAALSSASADQATYIYDDLGRLSQVIDGQGNVATYNYDAVGNLLSIALFCSNVARHSTEGDLLRGIPIFCLAFQERLTIQRNPQT